MGENSPIRILMLEDSAQDAELTELMLRSAKIKFVTERAASRSEFIAALGEQPDIILMDYSLPAFDGMAAVKLAQEMKPDVPVIMVTGALGDDKAADLIRAGARDFVLKDRMARLGPAVERALADAREQRARRAAEKALRASEIHYRRLFESAQDGILIIDLQSGKILDANPSVEVILGYSRAELLGRQLWDLGSFSEIVASKALFQELLDKPSVRYEHLPLRTKEGRSIDVELNSNVYTVGNEQVVQCNIRDISERLQAEAERRRSEKNYRALFESTTDGIVACDRQGRITDCNGAYLAMLGYDHAQLLELTQSQLVASGWREAEDSAARQLSQRGSCQEYELELIRKDGSLLPVSVKAWSTFDAGGSVTGSCSTVRDITERKRAEEQQRAALERLQRQQLALTHVSSAESISSGEVEQLAHQITEVGAQAMHADRAEIWLFEKDTTELHCIDVYEQASARHSAGVSVRELDCPQTFVSLIQSDCVIADDALADQRSARYVEAGLLPPGTKSMLDVLICVSGQRLGLLRHAHCSELHHWEQDEIVFARQLADKIGLAIISRHRRETERDLRQANRELKMRSSCNAALVHADTEAFLVQEVCRIICEEGGHRTAAVSLLDGGDAESLRQVAWSSDGSIPANTNTASDASQVDGITRAAIRSGISQVSGESTPVPSLAPWRGPVLEQLSGFNIAIPLKDGARVFGVLHVDDSDPNGLDEAEAKLLIEIGDELAFGLNGFRTRQEHEEGLLRLGKSMESTICIIAATMEIRDLYTAGHQNRVASLSEAIARELGLEEEQIHGLRLAASIHDVGKLHLPAEILSKPGRLSGVEYDLVKTHAEVGYDLLKNVVFPWPIADIVFQHHERMDGSGYPQGLRGQEILLEARIIGVADTIESMASHRPYRPAMGQEAALAAVVSGRGTLFDPDVVDACLRVFTHTDYKLPKSAA